ncbi:MAG: hypothetical protein R8G01_16650 [Ilumatobacteraceae bacterium]|nr:hypothetical protein [Ilumatobacteraceae bacterium]
MDIPTHPADIEDPTPRSRRSARIAIVVVLVVVALASLHFLSAALG